MKSTVFCLCCLFLFCFFNETATTEIYTNGHTLPLHDALPISERRHPRASLLRPRDDEGAEARDGALRRPADPDAQRARDDRRASMGERDRKSTRLNSSH